MTRRVVRPDIRWSHLNSKGANNLFPVKSLWRYPTVMMTLAMLLSIIVAPAVAQQNPAVSGGNVSIAPAAGQGPTDPAELKTFLDNYFATTMKEYHIAGAAVAIVKDGKLFFTKGYGYKDIEHGIPVDPEETMFRIGSNTKPFTWTAVMQLAEQGKVDLDADINTYLDFRIPDTFPQPITLKHLMTHTSGFGERWLESLASNDRELMSERDWLVSNMPARIFAPGEAVGYSDCNAAGRLHRLGAYPASPTPNTSRNISWTRRACPTQPRHRLHRRNSDQIYPVDIRMPMAASSLSPITWISRRDSPSGVIQASVTDMARFMIAQLDYGRYSDKEIPGARILAGKHCPADAGHPLSLDPRLRGMTYAFATSPITACGRWASGLFPTHGQPDTAPARPAPGYLFCRQHPR